MSWVAPVSAILVMMCTARAATSAAPGLRGEFGFALADGNGGGGGHDSSDHVVAVWPGTGSA
jgi:hypothetical protein